MNEHQQSRPIYARPVDRSLAAYKDFLLTTLSAVNPDATDDQTEQWWLAAWKEYWSAADAVPQDTLNRDGK